MSQRQLQRLEVMGLVEAGKITLQEGAEKIGMSYRQTKRIRKRVQRSFYLFMRQPLTTSGGVFSGVITVSGPTVRFTWDKRKAAGKKLIEVVRKLATQLGGFPGVF